jgi:hypothetical protein
MKRELAPRVAKSRRSGSPRSNSGEQMAAFGEHVSLCLIDG